MASLEKGGAPSLHGGGCSKNTLSALLSGTVPQSRNNEDCQQDNMSAVRMDFSGLDPMHSHPPGNLASHCT